MVLLSVDSLEYFSSTHSAPDEGLRGPRWSTRGGSKEVIFSGYSTRGGSKEVIFSGHHYIPGKARSQRRAEGEGRQNFLVSAGQRNVHGKGQVWVKLIQVTEKADQERKPGDSG